MQQTNLCLPRWRGRGGINCKIRINIHTLRGLSSAGEESACNVGDPGLIPGLGRSSGEGKGYPLQHSGLENSMDCMYSPWGPKESDMTERLSLSFSSVNR